MQPIVKALLSRPEISALVMLLAVVAGFALYAPQFCLQRQHPRDAVRAARTRHRRAGRRHPDDRRRVRPVGGLGVRAVADADGRGHRASWGVPPELGDPVWASPSRWSVGYINGWITLAFGIPSFVTTLGMLFMARSIATVLSGGFPPPFPADYADLAVRGRSRPVPRLDALVSAGFADHPRRDAALLQSRQLDLRHRRPAPGGRRHGHRHPPGEAVLLHAVQLPRRLRRHDHHLPPQVGAAGAGRGPGAAGDRRGGDRRHGADRRHRLGDRLHRRHLPDPRRSTTAWSWPASTPTGSASRSVR